MNWLGEFRRRFRMLIHRRQFDADLEDEMRLHLQLRQEEQLESGMPAYDAQRNPGDVQENGTTRSCLCWSVTEKNSGDKLRQVAELTAICD
jgi:hypothetical protein